MTDNAPHTVQRSIVGKGIAHDSAARHVAGEANYIDDMPELPGTLHAADRKSVV